MARLLLGVLALGAIAYAGLCAALWFGQTRIIFHPQPASATTPADAGVPYDDVWIPVGNGQIHGWWMAADDPHAKTVLILHGNASRLDGAFVHAQHFIRMGFSVLVVNYRGYGLSSGPFPNEARVYEDAAAAWNYLTQTRHIDPASIIVFGHSIGGAVAIDLVRHQPQVAGLIVQATFTSMADMMDVAGYSRVVPKRLLNQFFDSAQKLPGIQVPTFFIHGTQDAVVPAFMSEQLHGMAASLAQLWLVAGANHNNISEVAGDQYRVELQRWLSQLDSTGKPTEASQI